MHHSRSQWPRSLRCGSAAARLLALRVRIPPEAWMSVSCECCKVQVSATGRSFVQRSPTERGVSEYNLETWEVRRPRPTRVCRALKQKCMCVCVPICMHVCISCVYMYVHICTYICKKRIINMYCLHMNTEINICLIFVCLCIIN